MKRARAGTLGPVDLNIYSGPTQARVCRPPTVFAAGPARAEAGRSASAAFTSHTTSAPPARLGHGAFCVSWAVRATAPSPHPFSFPNRPGRHACCLLPQEMVVMAMALLLLLPRLASHQSSSRVAERALARRCAFLPNSTGDLPMTSCM
jgi:hypothetical protein